MSNWSSHVRVFWVLEFVTPIIHPYLPSQFNSTEEILVDLETSNGLSEAIEVPDTNGTVKARGGDGGELVCRTTEGLKSGDAVLVLGIQRLILGSIGSTELISVLPGGHVGRTTSSLCAGASLLIQRHSRGNRSSFH